MNRQKQTSDFTAGYACIQSFYWMSFSAVMGFTSLYLLDVGFTNTEIGIIIAIAGIISAILQPMFAGYADRPKEPVPEKDYSFSVIFASHPVSDSFSFVPAFCIF